MTRNISVGMVSKGDNQSHQYQFLEVLISNGTLLKRHLWQRSLEGKRLKKQCQKLLALFSEKR